VEGFLVQAPEQAQQEEQAQAQLPERVQRLLGPALVTAKKAREVQAQLRELTIYLQGAQVHDGYH